MKFQSQELENLNIKLEKNDCLAQEIMSVKSQLMSFLENEKLSADKLEICMGNDKKILENLFMNHVDAFNSFRVEVKQEMKQVAEILFQKFSEGEEKQSKKLEEEVLKCTENMKTILKDIMDENLKAIMKSEEKETVSIASKEEIEGLKKSVI